MSERIFCLFQCSRNIGCDDIGSFQTYKFMKTQDMDLTFDEKVKHRPVHTSVCYASLFNLRLSEYLLWILQAG